MTSPSMTSEVISAGPLGLHNTTLDMECAQCGTLLSISWETNLSGAPGKPSVVCDAKRVLVEVNDRPSTTLYIISKRGRVQSP
jgi:hypothetical protein